MATYSKGSVYSETLLTNAFGGTSIPGSGQISLYQVPANKVSYLSGWISLTSIGILIGPTTTWNDSRVFGYAYDGSVYLAGNPYLQTYTTNQVTKLNDGVTYQKHGATFGMIFFDNLPLRSGDYILLKNFVGGANSSWASCLTVTHISPA